MKTGTTINATWGLRNIQENVHLFLPFLATKPYFYIQSFRRAFTCPIIQGTLHRPLELETLSIGIRHDSKSFRGNVEDKLNVDQGTNRTAGSVVEYTPPQLSTASKLSCTVGSNLATELYETSNLHWEHISLFTHSALGDKQLAHLRRTIFPRLVQYRQNVETSCTQYSSSQTWTTPCTTFLP